MKPLKNMRFVDMVFYVLIVFGACMNIYVYMTLPDDSTCMVHYDNGVNATYPQSVCIEIHGHVKEGVEGLEHEEIMKALNKPECPVCVECPEPIPCPDCPVCPKCKPCPKKSCPVCQECPDPQPCPTCKPCTGIDGDNIQTLKNARPTAENPAYQGGYFDMKRLCLTEIGITPPKYNEAPSRGIREYYYGTDTEKLVCFKDQSNGKQASFKINRSIWNVTGQWIYKETEYNP